MYREICCFDMNSRFPMHFTLYNNVIYCRWEVISKFIKQHIPSSNKNAKDVLAKAKDLQKNGVCKSWKDIINKDTYPEQTITGHQLNIAPHRDHCHALLLLVPHAFCRTHNLSIHVLYSILYMQILSSFEDLQSLCSQSTQQWTCI